MRAEKDTHEARNPDRAPHQLSDTASARAGAISRGRHHPAGRLRVAARDQAMELQRRRARPHRNDAGLSAEREAEGTLRR